MQIPIEFRGVLLTVLGLLLWLPLTYNLFRLFFFEFRKKLLASFIAASVFSLIWGRVYPSPYLSWFGRLADRSKVTLNWWPNVLEILPHLPQEFLFFLSLSAIGILMIHFLFGSKKWLYGVWALILIQTFFHLSLHSPYSYLPHFEQPESAHYWYHSYLFPNNLGAVNEDCFWFWQSEALLLGSNGSFSVFWSRVLPFFFSSRLSTFIHPLYAWIILNTLIWLISVRAIYYISRTLFDEKTAFYSALLQTSSSAAILYVGQAKPYAFSFCLISILVALFLYLMKERFQRNYSSLNFGACLGATLLSYELQPWLIIFPIWARVLKARWREIFLFTAVGSGIYFGFQQVPRILPGVTVKDTFQPGYGSPVGNAVDLLLSFDIGRLWATLHYSLKSWWVLTFHAFSTILPFSLLGGIFIFRNPKLSRIPFLLILPGVFACLLIGVTNQSLYFQYPRMVFGNYVGMMLLAAIALNAVGNRIHQKFPYFLLAANTVYWNLDVWGFPQIYKHWFYRF